MEKMKQWTHTRHRVVTGLAITGDIMFDTPFKSKIFERNNEKGAAGYPAAPYFISFRC